MLLWLLLGLNKIATLPSYVTPITTVNQKSKQIKPSLKPGDREWESDQILFKERKKGGKKKERRKEFGI